MFNLLSLPIFQRVRVVVWYQTSATLTIMSDVGVIDAVEAGEMFQLGVTHKAICEAYMDEAPTEDLLDWFQMSMRSDVWAGDDRDHTIKTLLLQSGVSHTSMTVGDVLQIEKRYYALEKNGFKEINTSGRVAFPHLKES